MECVTGFELMKLEKACRLPPSFSKLLSSFAAVGIPNYGVTVIRKAAAYQLYRYIPMICSEEWPGQDSGVATSTSTLFSVSSF